MQGKKTNGHLHKHAIYHQPIHHYYTIQTNIESWENYKYMKYQPTKQERPTKYKTANKYQPEPDQLDTPNPKPKTK
jgi:hypothetical protein